LPPDIPDAEHAAAIASIPSAVIFPAVVMA
jgi:hypothetical protein